MSARLEAIDDWYVAVGLVKPEYILEEVNLIGREENRNIVFPENSATWEAYLERLDQDLKEKSRFVKDGVSRTHAKVFWDRENMVWRIRDGYSTNGTYLIRELFGNEESLTDLELANSLDLKNHPSKSKSCLKTIILKPGEAHQLKDKDVICFGKLPLGFREN